MLDLDILKRQVPTTPAFVFDQAAVQRACQALARLREKSGCKVLYSIKSLPLAAQLQRIKPWVDGFAVSSLFEARLSAEILDLRQEIHITTPGLKAEEMDELSQLCSQINFNSLPQYQRLGPLLSPKCRAGLRINPKHSFLDDPRYDPCCAASKLGIDIAALSSGLPAGVRGLHFHSAFNCRSFAPLLQTVDRLQKQLGHLLAQTETINLGGGYLYGDMDEDDTALVSLMQKLHEDYAVTVYIEPGKAVVGAAGYLVASVLDTWTSDGQPIAILDTSVNHLPEAFEYQTPPLLHDTDSTHPHRVLLAGCTCLAGDVFGVYHFATPPTVGDRVVFCDVGAYSLVKASRFNGYNWPSVYFAESDDRLHCVKTYRYADYRTQWCHDEEI